MIFGFIFSLSSCGGGGGGSSTTTFTGVAIDGNLYKAQVFLDLNDNGSYDSGEPTATTDASGSFTLTATQEQINSHLIIGLAIAGTTIDQDSPNSPLTSGMSLIAPKENPSVVSPLTTLVTAKIAGGLTFSAAKSEVQTELELTDIDVMKNYVAEKITNPNYSNAHKVAASIAEILKTIDHQSTVTTPLSTKFSKLKEKVTSQVVPILSQIKSAATLDDARTILSNSILEAEKIYSIGGIISGLNASGLVLIDGTNTVSISSGVTSFEFSSKKSTGGTYQVSIQSKPSTQTCSISNASGTVTTQSISNIAISCVNNPIFVMYDETGNGISANSGTVITNDEVYFQLFFNDPVIVNSGTPTLVLNSGGTAYYEVESNLETQYLPMTCYPNSDWTATHLTCLGYMRFKYTVASSDSSADLAISSINLNGSSIKNSSGGILDNSIVPTKNPQRNVYLKVN